MKKNEEKNEEKWKKKKKNEEKEIIVRRARSLNWFLLMLAFNSEAEAVSEKNFDVCIARAE